MSSEDGSFMSGGIVGCVTAYWGAKFKEAKLTASSNSQVRYLQDRRPSPLHVTRLQLARSHHI
jgi:hypothetical protein